MLKSSLGYLKSFGSKVLTLNFVCIRIFIKKFDVEKFTDWKIHTHTVC